MSARERAKLTAKDIVTLVKVETRVVQELQEARAEIERLKGRLAQKRATLRKALYEVRTDERLKHRTEIDRLVQVNDALEDKLSETRKALGKYGHHKAECNLDPCDCGILDALEEQPKP